MEHVSRGLSVRRIKTRIPVGSSSSSSCSGAPCPVPLLVTTGTGSCSSQHGEEKHHGGPAGKGCWELLLCKFRGRWREREGGQGSVSCLQWAGGKSLQHSPEMLSDALPQHSLPKGPIPKKARCLSKALVFSTPLAIPLQA